MPINNENVDLVVKYALLIAGQGDDFASRRLGPIHLLKYVYLADLYYAERNNGKLFSEASWEFYHFGPWSLAVHQRIGTATASIMAQKFTHSSSYSDDDFIRWEKSDDDLLRRISREIPSVITVRLKNDIRKYGKETELLLDYVYRTEPMLNAAPHEKLDFTVVNHTSIKEKPENVSLRIEKISNNKKKALHQKLKTLKDRVKPKKQLKPVTNSRFDDVFNTGVNWLDSLAGDVFPEGNMVASFSDDVWKSSTRKGQ